MLNCFVWRQISRLIQKLTTLLTLINKNLILCPNRLLRTLLGLAHLRLLLLWIHNINLDTRKRLYIPSIIRQGRSLLNHQLLNFSQSLLIHLFLLLIDLLHLLILNIIYLLLHHDTLKLIQQVQSRICSSCRSVPCLQFLDSVFNFPEFVPVCVIDHVEEGVEVVGVHRFDVLHE